jgi:predicted ABC-type ATPase
MRELALCAPQLVIVAGPNGAGKSTSAQLLLPPGIEYLNADEIASSLPPGSGRDVRAGRILFERWDRLCAGRTSFAVETTLSNRSLLRRIETAKSSGYVVALLFLWLPSEESAIDRVAERVRRGGHDIPESTIRRRYVSGLRNLGTLYMPVIDSWKVIDNSSLAGPTLVSEGIGRRLLNVYEEGTWSDIASTLNS